MGTIFTTIVLPVAVAIVMLGLGLGLTRSDFGRILRNPRIVLVALVCQMLLLPALCFGLVLAFSLPPELAVGMMLLAAAPGGPSANLISHLFRGDVALNIGLTAINSVISLVTLPIVVNLSVGYFGTHSGTVAGQFRTALDVAVIVLVPVVAGMLIRWRRPAWADRMDRAVRVASMVILVVVLLGAIVANWQLLTAEFGRLSVIAVLFCLLSLGTGFTVPRWLGAPRRQAIATSFEIGIHNAALTIVIAQTVLGSTELALPAAVYGVLMLPLAVAFGFLIRDRSAVPALPVAG